VPGTFSLSCALTGLLAARIFYNLNYFLPFDFLGDVKLKTYKLPEENMKTLVLFIMTALLSATSALAAEPNVTCSRDVYEAGYHGEEFYSEYAKWRMDFYLLDNEGNATNDFYFYDSGSGYTSIKKSQPAVLERSESILLFNLQESNRTFIVNESRPVNNSSSVYGYYEDTPDQAWKCDVQIEQQLELFP